MSKSILIVDDEENISSFLRDSFVEKGYTVWTAPDGAAGLAQFATHTPDIVILDLKLPDMDGIEILRKIKAERPDTQVIMITAYGKIKSAVEAIKLGAYDYVAKPFKFSEINVIVENACQMLSMMEQIYLLNREIAKREHDDIVTVSPVMKSIFGTIPLIAQKPSTVLITGETGTGKELVARAIHKASDRKKSPFTAVNCTSIHEHLFASELFGHEQGAFTDAKTMRKGLFEYSDGGTVFLDEIGDMPALYQAQILRVIEEKSFRRVGGNKDIRINVRIIAATNKDLAAQVKAGTFRQDLFYRLNVIPLHIPPLRERRDAILPLAEYFIGALSVEFGIPPKGISPEARRLLLEYDWPGNIRELKNLIERIMLLEPADTIVESTLNASLLRGEATAAGAPAAFSAEDDLKTATQKAAQAVERAYLVQTLESCGGNIAECARRAGVNRSHLYTLLHKHHLRPAPPPA